MVLYIIGCSCDFHGKHVARRDFSKKKCSSHEWQLGYSSSYKGIKPTVPIKTSKTRRDITYLLSGKSCQVDLILVFKGVLVGIGVLKTTFF